MGVPNNELEAVRTYQRAHLAYFTNQNAMVANANTKFKNFDSYNAQLGSTVAFDTPPDLTSGDGLVVSWQPASQNIHTLTVDKARHVGYEFTAEQFIFQARDYMDQWGKKAVNQLGADVEIDMGKLAVTNTYRFANDGAIPINSFGQLASFLTLFKNIGSANTSVKAYLTDTCVSPIVNTGANQFALDRNNKMLNSWEIGNFSNCDFYRSNLLPIHYSGGIGNGGAGRTWPSNIATIDSIGTPDANGAITQITVTMASAAVSDPNAVKQYDKFQFVNNTPNRTDCRYLTDPGYNVSDSPVQCRVTADAASDTDGKVVINFFPPLQWTAGSKRNVNTPIVAGMRIQIIPTHRAGLITSGNPMYLAMPRLPNQSPFYTGNEVDKETGVSVRLTYGAQFGGNAMGMIHDIIWGATLVDKYAMMIAFAP